MSLKYTIESIPHDVDPAVKKILIFLLKSQSATQQQLDGVIPRVKVATKSAATALSSTLTDTAFIEVAADESNGGAPTLYYWNNVSLGEPLIL